MTLDDSRVVGFLLVLAFVCGALFAHLVGSRTDRILEGVRVEVEAELDACQIEHATACAVDGLEIRPVGAP